MKKGKKITYIDLNAADPYEPEGFTPDFADFADYDEPEMKIEVPSRTPQEPRSFKAAVVSVFDRIKNLFFDREEKAEKAETKSEKPVKKSSKKGAIISRNAKRVLSVIGTTFLTVFLISVITVCIVAVALTVYVMQFAESSFDVDLKSAEMNFSSFVKAFCEEEDDWIEVKQLSGDVNRIWVDIVDMPQHLIDAIVANEDHRYFEHEGVDWFRTAGVIVMAAFESGDGNLQGGSTITQQLIKNITGDDKVTAGRKLREIFRALNLEQRYTKIDILESYLNRIAFGGTSNGVGSAARYYFDKEVEDLTIAEAALMAAVIPSPHFYNPYNNAERARERHKIALQQMHAHGFITTAEYDEALEEEIRFRRPIAGDHFGYIDERYNEWFGLQGDDEDGYLYYENVPWESIRTDLPYKWNGDYEVTQSWHLDATLWQVARDLAALRGVTEAQAWEMLRNGGFSIYSNVNLKMQERIDEAALNPLIFVNSYDPNQTQAESIQGGFVVMDYVGRVVAIMGGIGEKPGDNCFNRGTQAARQIGSTIKPISMYAPAIDMDLITFSTMTRDLTGEVIDYEAPDNRRRFPYNFGNRPGGGSYYPTWYALQKSHNTIAVRLLHKVGLQNAYHMMVNKLGVTTLDSTRDIDYSPLGTGTLDMNLYELAAAYAIFGNGGVYYRPYFYQKVVDHTGKVILEQDLIGVQAIDKDSAWVMNRMMKTVVEDRNGSGWFARIPNVEVVGKTGTSNDEKNLLFCAQTPEYVGVYRIHYDDGIRQLGSYQPTTGWRTPARAWHDMMVAAIGEVTTPQFFTADSTVQEHRYCNETGFIANTNCPSTTMGFYKAGNRGQTCPLNTRGAHTGAYWRNNEDQNYIPQYF
jgi:penicillin-binding protein 1A